FERIREAILTRAREPRALAAEIRAMREKLHAAHPNTSGIFDLKHDAGGMIDIEFAVQFLVLAHAREHRDMLGNLGNIALLRLAASHRLIEAELAERSEEHTSELQSPYDLVCRLLLEKKKK